MFNTIPRLSWALILILMADTLIYAAEIESKKDVEMDDASKKVLDYWKKVSYNLGCAGVKKATCSIRAVHSSKKAPTPLECKATYSWDSEAKDKKGILRWDDERLGAKITKYSWGAEDLDEMFDADIWNNILAGTKVTAKTEDQRTVLSLSPAGPDGLKELIFTKDGVLDEIVEETEDPEGKSTIRTKMLYKKEGEFFLCEGWRETTNSPGKGPLVSDLKIINTKTDAYFLVTKVEETVTSSGKFISQSTLEFSDYKFNDAAYKP